MCGYLKLSHETVLEVDIYCQLSIAADLDNQVKGRQSSSKELHKRTSSGIGVE